MLYEKELKKVYDEHFEKCKKCNNCNQYQLAKEYPKNHYLYSYAAKVGSNYDNSPLKILVIGQEQPKNRESDFSLPSTEAKNQHWKRTLLTIAKCFNCDNQTLNALEECKDMTELYKFATDFAFTNIYKCAFSKDENWSGSSVIHNKNMAKECSALFLKEIDILKPDLIIKQGKWNSDQIEKAIDKNGSIKLYKNKAINISLYKYNYFSDKPLYVIYTYHPTCQNPNWYKHKDALYECIDYLKNEIHENKRDD